MSRSIIKINGILYDITDYIELHPGGSDVFTPYINNGKDAGEAFNDVGHSKHAQQILASYVVQPKTEK